MSEPSSSWQQQHPGGEAAAPPHSPAYVGVPGVRFVPSDQELIIDYLWPKLDGNEPPTDLVQEADVYAEHPKDLTERLGKSVEGFWYVFSQRNRKYAKGKRPSRSTGTVGRWKAVGKNVPILLGEDKGGDGKAKKPPEIGHKCALAYELFVRDDGQPHSSRPRMEKTEWKMCEFVAGDTNRPISSAPDFMLLNDWVLCRIARKAAASQEAVTEDNGQAAPDDEPPHDDDEQPQGAPPDPSQLAQAMPNMPYHLLRDGAEEGAGAEGFDAGLEPPRDGDGAAADAQFDDEWSYGLDLWGDGSEYGGAFGHEEWNVGGFGPAMDPDPLLSQFGVLATDPYPALGALDVPADTQPWDIASTLFFSDDGHELVKDDEIVKANGDGGVANKTSAALADADSQK